MFLKTTNPTFLNFGDIVSSGIDFSCSNKINLNSRFVFNKVAFLLTFTAIFGIILLI